MTEPILQINTSFSQKIPGLQIAMDSTSLGALKTCARYYKLAIIDGYTNSSENVHLIFGLELHSALELYDRKRVEGMEHYQAVCAAVKQIFIHTWRFDLGRPWPSESTTKNRETLIRTVVWYLEQFKDDPLETLVLKNGKPAIELSFRLELGYGPKSSSDEYILCGHMDKVARLQGELWIVDRKTTKYSLDDNYFRKYSPENQVSTYALAGQAVMGEKVSGLIIDAAQVGVNFSRYRRGIITRTPSQLSEWLSDLRYWLRMAELYADNQQWPMNDKACTMYGGCPFQGVCSQAPEVRQQLLDTMYTKRMWDPLVSREV